ncbi:MAG: serine/threonine-protein kinase [Patescibacteria group bacterium]
MEKLEHALDRSEQVTAEYHLISTGDKATDKRFLIQGELGEGGMGTVYRGLDKLTNKSVAIKAFQRPKFGNQESSEKHRARQDAEAQILKTLHHPNLPEFVDSFHDNEGDGYIVMEYVDGRPLELLIQQWVSNLDGIRPRGSTAPGNLAAEVARQLLGILKYLHEQDYIHRDVKPANVMYVLEKGGIHVKLIDFGIGKDRKGKDSLTRQGEIMGTLNYMAPEQAIETKDVDHRADLYSVGVVLYEMVTGTLPIDLSGATSANQEYRRLMTEFQHPFPPGRYPSALVDGMNPLLEQLILRLMERDPNRRIQTADEALQLLEDALANDSPVSLRNSPPPPSSSVQMLPSAPPEPPKNKMPYLWTGMLMLLIGSIVALGYVVASHKENASATQSSASAATSSVTASVAIVPSSSVRVPTAVPPPTSSTVRVAHAPKAEPVLTDADKRSLDQAIVQIKGSQGACPRRTTIELMRLRDTYQSQEAINQLAVCKDRADKIARAKTGPP